jgi:hypothetical protein
MVRVYEPLSNKEGGAQSNAVWVSGLEKIERGWPLLSQVHVAVSRVVRCRRALPTQSHSVYYRHVNLFMCICICVCLPTQAMHA